MDLIAGLGDLVFDAIYLGILTARGLKPLSRLEYPIDETVLGWLSAQGLLTAVVTRVARNGARVHHLALSRDADLLSRYCAEFDRQPLRGETPGVIRREAHYFGYPACCAEAYIRTPHAPNHLTAAEQALFYHRACPGCRVTPRLIPAYRAALIEAQAVWRSTTSEESQQSGTDLTEMVRRSRSVENGI